MSLFIKHRPDTLDKMIGNPHVIESVKKLLSKPKKDIPHSWLFTGHSGIGKTTIARIIAKHLGATSAAIFEQNTADLRGIEAARELIKTAGWKVIGSPVTIYILDECHQLTKDAQNSLLKILEDPPDHVYFVLATTDPQNILGTIRTRCKEFKFEAVSPEDIVMLLADVAAKEGINLSPEILTEIAIGAGGSPRMALNILERCTQVGDDIAKARKLIGGGLDFQTDGEFHISGSIFQCLLDNSHPRKAWGQIAKILDEEVLTPNLEVNAIKRGLTNRMGRFLLRGAHEGVADGVMILESIQNMYSNASFVAIMYKVMLAYYKAGGANGQSESQAGPR